MAHTLKAALVEAKLVPPTPPETAPAKDDDGVREDRDGQAPGGIVRPNWIRHRTVGISRHAVERYLERFAPELNHAAARSRLEGRLYEGPATFTRARPRWLVHVSTNGDSPNALGYVILDDEVVLPIRETRFLLDSSGWKPFQPYYVITCLYRLHFDGESLS